MKMDAKKFIKTFQGFFRKAEEMGGIKGELLGSFLVLYAPTMLIALTLKNMFTIDFEKMSPLKQVGFISFVILGVPVIAMAIALQIPAVVQ